VIIEDPRPDREEASPLLLVHGFLGEPADWDAVVAALRVPRRIVRANLLQHGAASGDLASLAAALAFAIGRSGLPPVSLVGYSLGGRVTMTLASAYPRLVRRAIAVSATPGIRDRDERTSRAVADDTLASALARDGISSFLDRWYAQPLFDSLRSHPDFALIARRRGDGDARAWATILRDASPGANPSLWEALDHHQPPRGAQRLPPADGAGDAARAFNARDDAEVGVVVLRGRATWPSAPAATSACAATAATSATTACRA
jgi:2-succinyl-6-hydroxy-2,4-cyclohexadiene-1-carboxylate synthase